MIVLTAPVALGAIAVARTAALHRRIRTTGGTGVTARQQWSFWCALGAFFAAAGLAAAPLSSSHPVTTHVLVFVLITVIGVPLLMASLPEWWIRTRLGRLRAYRLARVVSTPWIGGPVAVAMILGTHLPWLADRLPDGASGSALLVAVWVGGGVLLWLPACSPVPEHRIAQVSVRCGYLAATAGVAPLVTGAFLISGAVPVLGLSTTAGADLRGLTDQYLAGALMYLLVVPLMWGAIAGIWFAAHRERGAATTGRSRHPSSARDAAAVRWDR